MFPKKSITRNKKWNPLSNLLIKLAPRERQFSVYVMYITFFIFILKR